MLHCLALMALLRVPFLLLAHPLDCFLTSDEHICTASLDSRSTRQFMWGMIRQLSSHVLGKSSAMITDPLLQALLREGSAEHVVLVLTEKAKGRQGGCCWPLHKPAVVLQGTGGCRGIPGSGVM